MDTNLQPTPDAERTAGSLHRDCYAAALKRMEARRDYWDEKKDENLRNHNLPMAAGYQCRAAGLCDAIAILVTVMEEQRHNPSIC